MKNCVDTPVSLKGLRRDENICWNYLHFEIFLSVSCLGFSHPQHNGHSLNSLALWLRWEVGWQDGWIAGWQDDRMAGWLDGWMAGCQDSKCCPGQCRRASAPGGSHRSSSSSRGQLWLFLEIGTTWLLLSNPDIHHSQPLTLALCPLGVCRMAACYPLPSSIAPCHNTAQGAPQSH